MNCTVCKEPMVVLELDEVEIDHCLGCGGVWLDSGEMELLLNDASEVRQFLAVLATDRQTTRGNRRCPICLKKMETVSIGRQSAVRVDRCRNHHGIWFDRGELEEVLTIFDTDRHSKALALIKEMFSRKER